MDTEAVVIQGVVRPDGTLELEGKVPLPPGAVRVTVQPIPPAAAAFSESLREPQAIRERDGVKADADAALAAATGPDDRLPRHKRRDLPGREETELGGEG
jgi:hypothetical protein